MPIVDDLQQFVLIVVQLVLKVVRLVAHMLLQFTKEAIPLLLVLGRLFGASDQNSRDIVLYTFIADDFNDFKQELCLFQKDFLCPRLHNLLIHIRDHSNEEV